MSRKSIVNSPWSIVELHLVDGRWGSTVHGVGEDKGPAKSKANNHGSWTMDYRLILLSITLLLLTITSSAQYTGFKPVEDLASFKKQFSVEAKKITSIKSNFVQEKNLGMLAEKITSKGKFWFKKDNLVRMEYNQPFQYLMVINNDRVFVKEGDKENKVSAR